MTDKNIFELIEDMLLSFIVMMEILRVIAIGSFILFSVALTWFIGYYSGWLDFLVTTFKGVFS